MSTSINANILKNFIIKTVGSELTSKEAQKLGIENEFQDAANELDVNMIDIDDVLDNNDLYEQFATLYVNDKEETDKVLKKHSDGKIWLHTGDLAYMDKDGFIFFKSRLKRMIVSSGYNISPSGSFL